MKHILGSRTFWVAVVQAGAGVSAQLFSDDPAVRALGYVALAKSVLDIWLRLNTTDPVSLKRGE